MAVKLSESEQTEILMMRGYGDNGFFRKFIFRFIKNVNLQ